MELSIFTKLSKIWALLCSNPDKGFENQQRVHQKVYFCPNIDCIEVNGVGLFEYVRGGLEVHYAEILTRTARLLDYSCTTIVLPMPDPLTHRLIWNLSTSKNPGSVWVSVSVCTMTLKYSDLVKSIQYKISLWSEEKIINLILQICITGALILFSFLGLPQLIEYLNL